MNANEEVLNDINTQISKARSALDLIYLDTESLRRTKASLEIEIQNMLKHKEYIDGLNIAKQTEIDKKVEDIKSLDEQIESKGRTTNELQAKVSELTQKVEDASAELDRIAEAHAEHDKKMVEDREVLSKSHAEANEKHRTADEKLAKIKAFVETL